MRKSIEQAKIEEKEMMEYICERLPTECRAVLHPIDPHRHRVTAHCIAQLLRNNNRLGHWCDYCHIIRHVDCLDLGQVNLMHDPTPASLRIL